jgi:hypothetical protein
MFKASVFADVMASCDGTTGLCFVKNDGVRPFNGSLWLNVTEFATGQISSSSRVVRCACLLYTLTLSIAIPATYRMAASHDCLGGCLLLADPETWPAACRSLRWQLVRGQCSGSSATS